MRLCQTAIVCPAAADPPTWSMPVVAMVFLVACSPGADEQLSTRSFPLVDGPVELSDGVDVSGGGVSGVSSMDARDLDGDGLVDVGVFEGGKHAGGRVTFAWFQAPTDPTTGSWTRHDFNRPTTFRDFIGAATFADVDGDDDFDLVVAMDNHSGGTRSAYLYWLENPRPGSPATDDWPVHTVDEDLPLHHINDMTTADMDDDGRLDIVFRSLDPNEIHVVFQNTGDSWTTHVLPTEISTGEGLAVGRIDADSYPDIAFNGVWLQAPDNPRTETYARHTLDPDYAGINANTKEDLGDIDGDGDLDLVISPAEGYRNGGNHVLAWYENPDDPTSGAWPSTTVASDLNGGHTVKLADMDGDCDLDIVSGVAWSMWGQTRHVSIYFNRDGNFDFEQVVTTGQGLYSGVVRDLGNDGSMDIVGQDTYAGNARPRVYVNAEGRGECMTGNGEDAGSDAGEDTPTPQDVGEDAPPTEDTPPAEDTAALEDVEADGDAESSDDSGVEPDMVMETPDSSNMDPDGDGSTDESGPQAGGDGTVDGGCGCTLARSPIPRQFGGAVLLLFGLLCFARRRARRQRRPTRAADQLAASQ